MKIVVVGASGRIGEKLVESLRRKRCVVVAASRSLGVNTITGAGLAEALAGADVVVDVSDSPSLEGPAAVDFFTTSTGNLLAAGISAGVGHHIALSVVGLERLLRSDYFRAKKRQEDLIKASPLSYTILRSTPFFELISDVAQIGTARDVAIAPALMQPVASDDVAAALTEISLAQPRNRIVEIAGPEWWRLDALAVEVLVACEDARRVVPDIRVPYFGAEIDDRSFLPAGAALVAPLRFEDWLRETLQPPPAALAIRGAFE